MKKTIKNLMIGTGLVLVASYATFKAVRKHQERALLKELEKSEEDYIEEKEEINKARVYHKIYDIKDETK